jgi:WD40 repeat protein
MNHSASICIALTAWLAIEPCLFAQETKPLMSFEVGENNVQCVTVSADGTSLATVSKDGSTVIVWDMATGKERRSFKDLKPPAYTAVLSDDGKVLSAPLVPPTKDMARGDKGGMVRVWDVLTGKERTDLKEVTAPLLYVEFSPDGTLLAGGEKDGRVRLWDAATGEVKAVLKGHTKEVVPLSFTADSKTLASGDAFDPGNIKIWDWKTGKQTGSLPGHPEGVITLEFTGDGKTLISSGMDGSVKVWDVAAGKAKTLFKGDKEALPWAAISPSGRTAAWTSGRPEMKEKKPDVVKVYNLVTDKELASLQHPATVLFVGFVAQGQRLVSCTQDGIVQVWDVASMREKNRER